MPLVRLSGVKTLDGESKYRTKEGWECYEYYRVRSSRQARLAVPLASTTIETKRHMQFIKKINTLELWCYQLKRNESTKSKSISGTNSATRTGTGNCPKIWGSRQKSLAVVTIARHPLTRS